MDDEVVAYWENPDDHAYRNGRCHRSDRAGRIIAGRAAAQHGRHLGRLARGRSSGSTPAAFTVRVELSGDKARVYLKQDTGWVEAKPGSFHVQRLNSNADDRNRFRQDEDGTWVETWRIAIAQKADDNALAVFSRLVSNEDLPATSDNKAFSVAGAGEMKRTH